jgi:hypothetical protein
MPARIWCDEECATKWLVTPTKGDTVYIRADIAEQMAEALRFYADPKNWTGGTILDMEASHFDGWSKAQAALSAWEASNA